MVAPAVRTMGAPLSASTALPTFAAPPGSQPNDLIICSWFQDDGRTSVAAPPAGFAIPLGAPQVNDPTLGPTSHRLNVYIGRFSAVGAGPYQFTVVPGAGIANPFCEGRSVAIQDAILSPVYLDDADGNTTGNTGANLAPPVTAVSTGTDRFAFYAATNWSGGAWTEPAGYAELWESANRILTFDTAAIAAPGPTSPQASCASSARSNAWVGLFLPIPPPVSPADVQWCAQSPVTGWTATDTTADWTASAPVTHWTALTPEEDC